jgi:biopolymer transport protein ExbD
MSKGVEVMKYVLEVCLIALAMLGSAIAQYPTKPALRPGITVEMPVAKHAVEIDGADQEDATVVSITADGNLFVGVKPVELNALDSLKAATVYVKADARAPFQRVLTVLDALRGHSVALLTAPTLNAKLGTITPPYGVTLSLGAN